MPESTNQRITSVGIDIGTTTTQLVISQLTIENTASGSLVPHVEITDKEVIHRSQIYFTPLIDRDLVNAVAVSKIMESEYQAAGLTPDMIDTGAVIITGETAKKENAKAIIDALAGFAGDFVVATAGANLEAIFAGKGSGAALYSAQRHQVVVNIDVGGGTSNYAVFFEGKAVDSSCINVGGHLIEFEPSGDRITYISEPAKITLQATGQRLQAGERITLPQLRPVIKAMADSVVDVLQTTMPAGLTKDLLMTPPLKLEHTIRKVMISGGVADYVYASEGPANMEEVTAFGDFGPLLGWELKVALEAAGFVLEKPNETVRATVIGTGTQSVNLSGSTIHLQENTLPLRNVMVISPFISDIPETPQKIGEIVKNEILRLQVDHSEAVAAIAMKGPRTMSFADINSLAQGLLWGLEDYLCKDKPIILVIEADCGKVLGQCINALADRHFELICIDQVEVDNCDYIDIGKPLMAGRVVPVVLKTLVFNR
ncbi:ethanolamine utilization protein, possible chaperonin protecting lyase from inhibition [Desulfosporosinus orientis DSM 765]|uniref:Ethanolamine utilization protein, possible chaperonin protecting lyase from inhibition n=1 Tax=Desulfosporosinus orientis (strain ATCC 19365 / DSM 765 / NCIMB 8382 / VKM B-1628 / Singapore I) TaxID=768706 RepID=G7WEV9_DESOD|nr:ethanolamine ammonia-lyase reactivating factor EutA [Desulfosporosinus orientis]AET67288.1 ethanolamine utilization protein, possible chaperonin protecting lyase from inhibition [Desulfosporosinus orientis DSM 765]